MKKRILLGLALLIVLLLALTAYVALPVRDDLLQARAILGGPIEDLTDEKVRDANASINRALTRLDGIPARILGFVPIAGDNLEAIEAVAARIPPALDAGLEVKAHVDDLEQRGIFEDGRVRLDALADLRGPLEDEVAALGALEQALSENRTGRLLPPTWDSFDELLYDVRTLREDAAGFTQVLASLDSLLAENGKKTYLTLLLNNAELRGAGGILTGIGTMTAENGKLRTSGFTSVHSLRTERRFKVPVPEDFKRFRIYGANDTSIFLNTTYSPDVPDVAMVAARLYERVTGVKTQGAIAIDPRGVAALMPQDAEIPVPKSNVTLGADELAEFIYSDAYEEFSDQQQRREAILQVGERAFDTILDADLDDREDLERAADAIGGGHLRFVSFDDTEQAALRTVGATGDFEPTTSDSLHVVVQNRGGGEGVGSKMDYWTSRKVAHGCEIRSEDQMICVTSVTITNEAPRGLPPYVTGGNKPYGLMRAFVEVFVPGSAEVEAFERDGEEAPLVIEGQAGRTSLGLSTTIPLGESTRIQTAYTLPIEDGYSLVASPQPLTEDAEIELALGLPPEWTVRGPGRWEDGIFRYQGTFDETLSISAAPAGRTGLPALWESLKSFWSEPLF